MNRPFSRRRNTARGIVPNGASGIAIVVIVVLFLILGFLRLFAPQVLTVLATPLWNIGSYLSSFSSSASLESKSALRTERDALSAEQTVLTEKNAALSAQVDDLTRLLGGRTEPEKGIVASVLARPPVAPYDVLILDQGTAAGVTIDAVVFGPGGTPIGTIGGVDSTGSRATLFSTRGLETSGWVGTARIPVTITGAGAGAFRVTVPKDIGITIGDGVYIAGKGALPIGTVVKIESDPSSPNVDLDVHPYTNPFSLTWVTITRQ